MRGSLRAQRPSQKLNRHIMNTKFRARATQMMIMEEPLAFAVAGLGVDLRMTRDGGPDGDASSQPRPAPAALPGGNIARRWHGAMVVFP